MNEPKQVIVMRTDLKMRKGKMIAQGAHASMKVLLGRLVASDAEGGVAYSLELSHPAMAQWIFGSFVKICVRADSEEAVLSAYEAALDAGIPCALIEDEGRTEFNGVKTITCCAIGPADSSKIDAITGHLKLL